MSPLLAILVILVGYFVLAVLLGCVLGRILKSERKYLETLQNQQQQAGGDTQ